MITNRYLPLPVIVWRVLWFVPWCVTLGLFIAVTCIMLGWRVAADLWEECTR